MNWNFVHSVWALVWHPRKTSLGVQTLCMIFLLCLASPVARADCPAAPISDPDDMAISFLKVNGVQAASASLQASTVKEGVLVYDNADDALKICDGTSWIEVGSGGGGGAAASGPAGYLQLSGGTNLTHSSETVGQQLFWDSTNHRLGIGTAAPNKQLHISGDGSARIGIGLTQTTANVSWNINNFETGATEGAGNFGINQVGVGARLIIDTNGNAGIGVLPTSRLHVAGGIQLGDDTATCPGASNVKLGTMRFNGGDIQICKSGGWMAIGSGGSGTQVAFDVFKSSDQTGMTWGSGAVVAFDTELLDSNNNFASNKFTPTVAGNYLVTTSIDCGTNAANGCYVTIRKNGTTYASNQGPVGNGYLGNSVTTVVAMNGSTDYLDVNGQSISGTVRGVGRNTHFSGFLIGGGGGGSSQWTTAGNDLHYATGGVAIGQASAPDASTLLELESTSKGLLLPRLTTAQVTGVASPADGLLVYDADTDTLKLRANGAWASIGGGGTPGPYLRLSYSAGTLDRANVIPFTVAENGGGATWAANKFTAVTPGVYVVTVSGYALGQWDLVFSINKNGSEIVNSYGGASSATKRGGATATATTYLNAGDYVDFFYNHDTGGIFLNAAHASIAYLGAGSSGGSGSSTLAGLSDVSTTGIANGKSLVYNSTSSKWEPQTISGGATPAGNDGSIQFKSGSNLAADAANLHWDDTNDRLGIGTASPTYRFHLVNGDFMLESTAVDSNNIRIKNSGNNIWSFDAIDPTNSRFRLITEGGASGNAERLTVLENGNVGIGTTSPGSKLHVNYSSTSGVAAFVGDGAPYGVSMLEVVAPSGWLGTNHVFTVAKGPGGPIDLFHVSGDGNAALAGSLTQNSDRRLKEDIRPIGSALDKISKLQGVSYVWRDKSRAGGRHLGLIAQDVETVFPEAVQTQEAGLKSVAYTDLIAPMIEALKELKADNDNLRAELKTANDNQADAIEDLRREVEALKATR